MASIVRVVEDGRGDLTPIHRGFRRVTTTIHTIDGNKLALGNSQNCAVMITIISLRGSYEEKHIIDFNVHNDHDNDIMKYTQARKFICHINCRLNITRSYENCRQTNIQHIIITPLFYIYSRSGHVVAWTEYVDP